MDLKEEWTIHNEQVYQWTIVPMATWNFFAEVVSSLNNSVCVGGGGQLWKTLASVLNLEVFHSVPLVTVGNKMLGKMNHWSSSRAFRCFTYKN